MSYSNAVKCSFPCFDDVLLLEEFVVLFVLFEDELVVLEVLASPA